MNKCFINSKFVSPQQGFPLHNKMQCPKGAFGYLTYQVTRTISHFQLKALMYKYAHALIKELVCFISLSSNYFL